MRVLLDTHCWLWWLASPHRLGRRSRSIIEDGRNEIYFSAASSWEIAIKYSLGKLHLPEDPQTLVPAQLALDGFISLSIETSHTLHVVQLPRHHRDPFDRLLVAQCQLENLRIMTADPQVHPYDVEIVPANL